MLQVGRETNLRVQIPIDPETQSQYDRLLREQIPIDLSPQEILRLGTSRILNHPKHATPEFRRTPEEELDGRRKLSSELDQGIREKMAAFEELHRNCLTYQEDNAILEYYSETMDLLIQRMKNLLAKRGR